MESLPKRISSSTDHIKQLVGDLNALATAAYQMGNTRLSCKLTNIATALHTEAETIQESVGEYIDAGWKRVTADMADTLCRVFEDIDKTSKEILNDIK